MHSTRLVNTLANAKEKRSGGKYGGKDLAWWGWGSRKLSSIRCLSSKVLKKQRARIRVGEKSLPGPVGPNHCRQPGVLQEQEEGVGVAKAEEEENRCVAGTGAGKVRGALARSFQLLCASN